MPSLLRRPCPRWLLVAGLLLVAFAPSATFAADDAAPLLHAMRQAYGGARWQRVGALLAEGEETSEGLAGPYAAAVDLRHEHWAVRVRNALLATADGVDAQGRWHQDSSGLVHPLDSDEAKQVAANSTWLYAFGFLADAPRARFRLLPDAVEDGHRYRVLEAAPQGGRTLTLWIDPATHRLDRASWLASFQHYTQRYSDYRTVDGLALPHRIVTLVDGHEAATDTITRYRVAARAPAAALQRPDGRVRDVAMAHGATQASTPMRLEGGFLLVDAMIDGKGPLPFILDTGGHAILTADAAKKLGYASQGNGVSAGSGPGTMSTAYTQVKHLALGDADIRDLTFLVMPYPYGFYERGEQAPIAGILGLEIFERFAVTFDYDHGRLRLQPFDHGAAPASAAGEVLPLRFTDDMPLIEAALDGHAGMFGIDTGNAGYLLAFPQWAERAGIVAHYAAGAPMPTGGVGGTYMAHLAHARSLALGGQTLTGVVAMLTRADAGATGNPSEAGNIGQDVLSRFNVHFDYRRQQMVLMPRAQPVQRHYATAGFRAGKQAGQPDRFQVAWVLPGGPAAQAGLKAGDAIVAVDGTPAAKLGLGTLRDLVGNRAEGTRVELKLADGRTLALTLRDIAPH